MATTPAPLVRTIQTYMVLSHALLHPPALTETHPLPPPYENPNKTRHTRRDKNSASIQPTTKERELESPEKWVAHRRSSLPNAITVSTQEEDPFLANYQGSSAVRLTSRAPSRNRGPFRQCLQSTGAHTPGHTHQDSNPHILHPAYTPSGPDDLVAATTNFQINTGEWRALVMAFQMATKNTAAAQIDAALADPPAMRIVVLPTPPERGDRTGTSSGTHHWPQWPLCGPPTAAKKPLNERDKYNAPLAMIGRAATPTIRDALLSHAVIPINKSLAVHVLPIDTDTRTWTMGLFKCNWPGGGEEIAASFRLAAFKEARKKGPFRDLIVQATQPDPIWVMYGRPCTTNFELWEAIRHHTRNMSMEDGLTLFLPSEESPEEKNLARPPHATYANSMITSRTSARMPELSTGEDRPKSSPARLPVSSPADLKGKAATTKAVAGGVSGVRAVAEAMAARMNSPQQTQQSLTHAS
ncbi:hypothetical protein B0H10DRAFT_1943092 [Mycena sp. CBHHK59/15]|nr:hypothetical protein B0H10DRAFT_1943092 [Mycena sp. CBHHK59/15]